MRAFKFLFSIIFENGFYIHSLYPLLWEQLALYLRISNLQTCTVLKTFLILCLS